MKQPTESEWRQYTYEKLYHAALLVRALDKLQPGPTEPGERAALEQAVVWSLLESYRGLLHQAALHYQVTMDNDSGRVARAAVLLAQLSDRPSWLNRLTQLEADTTSWLHRLLSYADSLRWPRQPASVNTQQAVDLLAVATDDSRVDFDKWRQELKNLAESFRECHEEW